LSKVVAGLAFFGDARGKKETRRRKENQEVATIWIEEAKREKKK